MELPLPPDELLPASGLKNDCCGCCARVCCTEAVAVATAAAAAAAAAAAVLRLFLASFFDTGLTFGRSLMAVLCDTSEGPVKSVPLLVPPVAGLTEVPVDTTEAPAALAAIVAS